MLRSRFDIYIAGIRNIMKIIRCDYVRNMCMNELAKSGASVKEWLELWGREEKLDLKA